MTTKNLLLSLAAAAGALAALLALAFHFLSGLRPDPSPKPEATPRRAAQAPGDAPADSLPAPPAPAAPSPAASPAEGPAEAPPAVLLRDKYLIRGRIVEAASPASGGSSGGAAPVPVPGVTVSFKRHPRRARAQDQPVTQTRVTGEDGLFAFGGISWGMWLRLDIDAPGRALKTLSCDLADPQGEGQIDLGDLFVEPAVTLALEVVSPDGDLVPGAKVQVKSPIEPRLEAAGMFESHKEAVETEPGRYVVERVPPGIPRVTVEASGFSLFREHLAPPKEGPIVARLEWGLAIAGLVTDPEGKPIADATLQIEGPKLVFPYPKARTGAAGDFRFDQLSVGVYNLRARAKGFGEAWKRELKAGGERATIVLEPEAVLAGRVVAKDGGAPVAGARVFLAPAGLIREAVSGADGGFRLEGIAAGEYWLTADHEGYALAREGPLAIAAGQSLADHEVQLDRGRTVAGRLSDGRTGDGIAGVWVSFTLERASGEPATHRLVKTDADGSYAARALAPGAYVVTARARGYLSGGRRGVEVEGEDVAGFDLTLEAGNSLSGRVVDAGGQPIAGAAVRAGPAAGGGAGGGISQTDAEGHYRLEGVRAGEGFTIRAEHADYASGSSEPFSIGDGDSLEGIDVVLRAGGSIHGRVVDAGGRGIAGAEVRPALGLVGRVVAAEFPEGIPLPMPGDPFAVNDDSARRTIADAEGRFTIPRLEPGTYSLGAQAKDFLPAVVHGVAVAEGKASSRTRIALEAAQVLRGLVADPARRPIAGAVISGFRPGLGETEAVHATSDDSGRFEVRGLPAGRFALHASRPGYVGEPLEAELPAREDLVVTLRPGARVTGWVLAGSPVNYAQTQVTGFSAGGGDGWRSAPVRVDSTGEFAIDVLPGQTVLVAMSPGFAPSRSRPLSAGAGARLEGVEVFLNAGGAVRGRLLAPEGAGGAVGVAVQLDPTDGVALDRVRGETAEDGGFLLEGVPEGTYRATFDHPGYARAVLAEVRVAAGKITDLAAELGLAASIHGRVFAKGKLPEGLRIELRVGEAGKRIDRQAVEARADGSFAFPKVEPGEVVLRIAAGDPAAAARPDFQLRAGGRAIPAGQSFTLAPGETIEVEMEMKE